MTGREGFVCGVGLMALLVLIAWLVLRVGFGTQAVSCVDENRPASWGEPAMIVEVTTHRKGHIIEHHLFGCTFYDYHGPPWAT